MEEAKTETKTQRRPIVPARRDGTEGSCVVPLTFGTSLARSVSSVVARPFPSILERHRARSNPLHAAVRYERWATVEGRRGERCEARQPRRCRLCSGRGRSKARFLCLFHRVRSQRSDEIPSQSMLSLLRPYFSETNVYVCVCVCRVLCYFLIFHFIHLSLLRTYVMSCKKKKKKEL